MLLCEVTVYSTATLLGMSQFPSCIALEELWGFKNIGVPIALVQAFLGHEPFLLWSD